MNWWQKRKLRGHARELVKATRKLVRMHGDILNPQSVEDLTNTCETVSKAVSAGNVEALNSRVDKLDELLAKVFPRPAHAAWRENVEVFLVAAIVAMGVRTFFLQPFKIPTGSMQPTLYGIYPYRDAQRREPPLLYKRGMPSLPVQLFGMLFGGKIYEGDGYRVRGDHIFVDRFTYHFRKPHRGEVIVFDTSDIKRIPESSRGKYYIKRLIGLGGDKIQIQPPYVLVNGSILDERPAFKRIYSRTDGYHGYVLPGVSVFPPAEAIRTVEDIYEVPPKHFFALGDNSVSSLDGRFWGSVPEHALVGRAVLVYWPFTKRFGPVD